MRTLVWWGNTEGDGEKRDQPRKGDQIYIQIYTACLLSISSGRESTSETEQSI